MFIHRLKSSIKIVLTIILLCVTREVFAVATFLNDWRDFYPDSTSSDINCQLCHADRDGGAPWNAYGSALQQHFSQADPLTREIEDSFSFAEGLNSDQDNPSTSNLAEINSNQQPGWRAGQVNNIFNADGEIIGVTFPPTSVDPFPEEIATQDVSLELIEIASGFTSPLGASQAPLRSLSSQFFVVDQIGIVWRVDLETGNKSEYLNIQSRLVPLGAFAPGSYDERGLLGFAFHPQFSSNGRLYIHTSEPTSGNGDLTTVASIETANHQGVISEFIVADPSQSQGLAVIRSERELLRINQPQFNHNGGDLVFDSQGFLYIGLGDGGNADDQGPGHSIGGNASDPLNPLGSILRIDPLGDSHGAYGVPSDNPFINDNAALDEIFAYGFRNPWKLSFDNQGNLYAADVGQNDIEEVNRVIKGQHYGWRFREGRFFFDANGERDGILTFDIPNNLPFITLTPPLLEYDHDEGISVIGGYVYNGSRNPSLRGKYIFGDFLSTLFIGDLNDGSISKMKLAPEIVIFGFAQDSTGELYFMGNQDANTSGTTGKLIKLQSTLPEPPEDNSLCFPIVAENQNVSVVCL